jgi:hypothetical protein
LYANSSFKTVVARKNRWVAMIHGFFWGVFVVDNGGFVGGIWPGDCPVFVGGEGVEGLGKW